MRSNVVLIASFCLLFSGKTLQSILKLKPKCFNLFIKTEPLWIRASAIEFSDEHINNKIISVRLFDGNKNSLSLTNIKNLNKPLKVIVHGFTENIESNQANFWPTVMKEAIVQQVI